MIKKGVIIHYLAHQKQPIQNEPPTSENRNPTQPNTTQQNNPEQTLTQEQKLILRNLKRIKQWKYQFTIIKKHWMENS